MRSICVVLLALSICVLGAYGSSHSESPNTADSPVSDWTDLYAFRSYETGREDYVTILANLYGLQAPFGGPNYYTISDQFFYEIYIDADGDCVEDWTFRFIFGSELAGEVVPVIVEPNDRDCNATGESIEQNIKGGLTLDIGLLQNIPVPLKTLGAIQAGDNGGLNWHEYYTIDLVVGTRDSETVFRLDHDGNQTFIKPFDYAGTKTFPDYAAYAEQYIYDVDLTTEDVECDVDGKVFVGQRADPFYITLGKIFDLLNLVPIPGFDGAIEDDPINNDLRNRNVHTIALEIPYDCFWQNDAAGLWLGSRKLFHDGDGNHIPGGQTSRLGNPLVNELVIGLPDKAKFSHSHPTDDTQFLDYVTNPTLPEIISMTYKDAVNKALKSNYDTLAPALPRLDLVAAFLTGVDGLNQVGDDPTACEYLRLNTAIAPVAAASQNNMGVINGDNAGFPNGRRPGDDLVDIALRVVMGRLCHLNLTCTADDAPVGGVDFIDGSPVSAADFTSTFPYLNTPYPGATDDLPESCDGGAASAVESVFFNVLEAVFANLL